MKKLFSSLVALIFAMGVAFSASAQTLKVGAGSKGLTYDRQLQEINKFCSGSLALTKEETNGAVMNMEKLLGNEIQGAWTQVDILYMMAKNQDLNNVKTLLVMHPEQLHFIVKSAPVKVGGTMGFGGKEVFITELPQIANMNVAAAGGAVWTAKQVRLDSEIPYNIVEVPSSADAIKLLAENKVQVALVVGGAPLDSLKALNKDYRILRVPESVQAKIKGAYSPDRVTYSGMMESQGVQTVSVQSQFVVREYKTERMQQALASLRACVLNNIDEIKETPGTHPSWQKISMEAQGSSKWPLYKLPEVSVKKK